MSEVLNFKNKLIYTSERISQIADRIPHKLENISSFDTSGRDEQNIYDIVNSIRKRFDQLTAELETPFKIAVVGSQGTGKSTLVNLLLGEALMPSTTMENESAVVRLAYPPDESKNGKAIFQLSHDTVLEMDFEQAKKLIDKKERNPVDDEFVKNIKYVTFYHNTEQLKKIELINTPGMNVITDDFYPKIQHLFTEADVILWVNGGEKILDQFNSWLIKKIHADNNKIVGLITFPDKLYRQDENKGVTDVVTQFMEKIEDNKLIRKDGKVALFVFNGNFAQIGESQKTNFKFINDLDDLEGDEEKMRMIYNYLHHGFSYSDDPSNVKILKDYGLYGLINSHEGSVELEGFSVDYFFDYCIKNGFCQIDKEENVAIYTKQGLQLLKEASQYYSFGRFADSYLIPMADDSKLDSVKNRLSRILSYEASEDTVVSRIYQIKENLIIKKNQLGEEEAQKLESLNTIARDLKIKLKHWHSSQIEHETNNYSYELTDKLLSKIEKEIGGIDFFKEIIHALKPEFLKRDSNSAVSNKISAIVEEVIEEMLPKSLESYANKINDEIEYILIQMQKDYYSDKNSFNSERQKIKISVSPTMKTKPIRDTVLKLIKPLMKKLLISIAKKDLRKGANTLIKKNIVKPLVILIRKTLVKFGVKFAKKKAASTAVKGGLGPIGWGMIIFDLATTAFDIREMYCEMKSSIADSLKDEPIFRNSFKEEASNIINLTLDAVIQNLEKEYNDGSDDTAYIVHGITACEDIMEELKKFSKKEVVLVEA